MDPIYQEVAAKITKEKNKTLPKVLAKIATVEQAKILRELPETFETLVQKLDMNEDTLKKELQYLYERGLAMRGRKRWALVNNLILVKDLVASAQAKYNDPELFELLHVMSLEDSDNLEERLKNGERIPPVIEVMRVVPKWRAIQDIPGVLPIEDAREILKQPPIVVHNCPCRVVFDQRPCKDDVPIDVCLASGDTGRMYLERGAGKELTYDQAIELLDKLDQSPLVNTVGNSDRMPNILCSCCNDCCGLFVKAARTQPVLGKVPYAKSRFVIQDDPEECTACEACLGNRCPVGAISMRELPGLEGERAVTDVEACIGCGLCVLTCPTEARTMKLVRLPEHIPDPASLFDNAG